VGRLLATAGRDFLTRLEVAGELSIAITTDRKIHSLNRLYRKVDRPTDVLSFPGDGACLLGDVVISLDTAKREARGRGIQLVEEVRRYLAHGILHLLGHDHHRKADATRMAKAERRLLGDWGMVGPRR
jgi:probable rRNA maturation factor